ncbi:hypothetical protein V1477_009388 [Vespula maculifrons]|uniref:Uncharacterized protein n=1 Tax=Vespula maculifrons TaxID=7453 RepID=A0ABD2C9M3_VESMC
MSSRFCHTSSVTLPLMGTGYTTYVDEESIHIKKIRKISLIKKESIEITLTFKVASPFALFESHIRKMSTFEHHQDFR